MAENQEPEEVLEQPEVVETPAPSQQSETVEQPETEETQEEQVEISEEEPEEQKPPSRRESLRIQQLLEKLKTQPQQQQPVISQGLDYGRALDADPEVIKQLEADRNAVAQAQYQQGLSQAQGIQFRTMLEIDAPKIEAKYSQLDKDSQDFDPATSDAINRWYLATVGYDQQTGSVQNSNVRYSDFVEGLMELADRMAGEKTVTTAKNVARQAATTGLRPNGGTAKSLNLNKPPEQMSDEELKAVLSQAGM